MPQCSTAPTRISAASWRCSKTSASSTTRSLSSLPTMAAPTPPGPPARCISTGAMPGCRDCRSRSISSARLGSAPDGDPPFTRWVGRRSPTLRSRPTRPIPAAAGGASALSSRGRRSSRISGPIRTQFGHVIDVMPTLLDLAGVPALETSHGDPAQPMQGKSLAPVLRDADATGAAARAVLRMLGQPGLLPRRLGRGLVAEEGARPSISTIGHCTPMPRISPRASIWRRQHPAKARGAGRGVRRRPPGRTWSIRSTTAHRRRNSWRCRRISGLPAIGRRRFLPNGQTVHRNVIAPLIGNRNFTITARFRPRRRGRGRAVRDRRRRRRSGALHRGRRSLAAHL